MILCITPCTVLSEPFDLVFGPSLRRLEAFDEGGPLSIYGFAYRICGFLLLYLLIRYVHVRVGTKSASAFTNLGDAACFLGLLYLINGFTSPSNHLDFSCCWWPFFVLSSFFIVILYLNSQYSFLLVAALIAVITVQEAYAVVYHLLTIKQFFTPHFGNRTSGTFDSPNALYPLCLCNIPIALALIRTNLGRPWRWLFRVSAALGLLTLFWTYTRAGWMSVSIALIYLSVWQTGPRVRNYQTLLRLIALTLLCGAIFIRTNGNILGNGEDRSAWGRIAIWQVAGRASLDHPVFGMGLGSYYKVQNHFMTPRLAGFNPRNAEAKSLYLNTCVELGFVGAFSVILFGWRYSQMLRLAVDCVSDRYMLSVVSGIHAVLIAFCLAGLVDTPILQSSRVPSTLSFFLLAGAAFNIVGSHGRSGSAGFGEDI